MRDFFDLNNDGKLDLGETILKDAHIWYCIDQLEKKDDTPSVRHSYRTTYTTSGPSTPGAFFLFAFITGLSGIGGILGGVYLYKYFISCGIGSMR